MPVSSVTAYSPVTPSHSGEPKQSTNWSFPCALILGAASMLIFSFTPLSLLGVGGIVLATVCLANGVFNHGNTYRVPDPDRAKKSSEASPPHGAHNTQKPRKPQEPKEPSGDHKTFVGLEKFIPFHAAFVEYLSTLSPADIANRHFDWWMFPCDQSSLNRGTKYKFSDPALTALRNDPAFMEQYRRGVHLVLPSLGYDLARQTCNRDIANVYTVRLGKMLYSLRLLGEDDLRAKILNIVVKQIEAKIIKSAISEKKPLKIDFFLYQELHVSGYAHMGMLCYS